MKHKGNMIKRERKRKRKIKKRERKKTKGQRKKEGKLEIKVLARELIASTISYPGLVP